MSMLQALPDLFWPEPCEGCGGPSGLGQDLLCTACRGGLPKRLSPVAVPEGLAGGWALGPYQGPLGALVRRAKFRPDPRAATVLATQLALAARGRLPGADQVVPVPTAFWRLLNRGFNPAAVLARPVAAGLGAPVGDLLRRRLRASQVGLGASARWRGARGAFRCDRPARGHVLLVDDVRTTGATAQACAYELLGAGAKTVTLVVVCARAAADVPAFGRSVQVP